MTYLTLPRVAAMAVAAAMTTLVMSIFAISPTVAQSTWPTRAITLVVPFTAGTTSDVIARGLVEHLATALG